MALREGADAIVTVDADGQHEEDDIRFLVEPILAGECDIMLGSRFLGCGSGAKQGPPNTQVQPTVKVSCPPTAGSPDSLQRITCCTDNFYREEFLATVIRAVREIHSSIEFM